MKGSKELATKKAGLNRWVLAASLSQSIQLDGLRRHRDSIALEIDILEGKIQDNPYDYNINEWKERLRKLKIELQQTYDKVNDIINIKGESQ